MNSTRPSETFLLTLASKLDKVSGILVLVQEEDGAHHYHHVAIRGGNVRSMLGHLECLKADMISTLCPMVAADADGSAIPEEGENESNP